MLKGLQGPKNPCYRDLLVGIAILNSGGDSEFSLLGVIAGLEDGELIPRVRIMGVPGPLSLFGGFVLTQRLCGNARACLNVAASQTFFSMVLVQALAPEAVR